MIPGEYNIDIDRGSTFIADMYAYTDFGGRIDFEANYNLIRMQFRQAWQKNKTRVVSGTPLYELSTTNGKIVLDRGKITVSLTAAETAAFVFAKAVYDLELVNTTLPERVDKLLHGTVTIKGERTI